MYHPSVSAPKTSSRFLFRSDARCNRGIERIRSLCQSDTRESSMRRLRPAIQQRMLWTPPACSGRLRGVAPRSKGRKQLQIEPAHPFAAARNRWRVSFMPACAAQSFQGSCGLAPGCRRRECWLRKSVCHAIRSLQRLSNLKWRGISTRALVPAPALLRACLTNC